MSDNSDNSDKPDDFIRKIIRANVAEGLHEGRVHTRFPPEPNGYLQIGHAKAICLNFEVAQEFGGLCNLRFDDTNPEKESEEFVQAIQDDIRWLGFEWDKLCFSSDYFEQLFEWAHRLIEQGMAYVDEQDPDAIKENRGSLTEPGKDSPFRNRPAEESIELFNKMRSGDFQDGAMVLRAKIDMTHPNMNMRDPILYRIKRMHHHRVGDAWPIYPSYDFTHGQSDSIEGITHSLCSLEFEDHRPLYDWFIEKLGIFPSKQTEFSRLNMTYTVVSKRKLRELVDNGLVDGWEDPRMPTIAGMRNRGYPALAIRNFCKTVGITKVPSISDIALLEHSVRDVLNRVAPRRMAIFDPLEIELTNWEQAEVRDLEGAVNPEDAEKGLRKIPFGKTLLIERNDFREEANRKFFRLKLGGEVRLRNAYIIRCDSLVKDPSGNIVKLLCHVDLDTLGKNPEDRKVKGVIHWVNKATAVEATARQLGRLFTEEKPESNPDKHFTEFFDTDSSKETTMLCEPSILDLDYGETCQFERIGYYCRDAIKEADTRSIYFNQTISLKEGSGK